MFGHLSDAPVENVSTPRSLLLGLLLRETACLLQSLAARRLEQPSPITKRATDDVTAPVSPLKSEAALSSLVRLQLDPLVSSLGIDLFSPLTAVALRNRSSPASSTVLFAAKKTIWAASESHVLSVLLTAGGINDRGTSDQVYAYLELALGVPRVLRAWSGATLATRLFVPPAHPRQIRMLCFILMRGEFLLWHGRNQHTCHLTARGNSLLHAHSITWHSHLSLVLPSPRLQS